MVKALNMFSKNVLSVVKADASHLFSASKNMCRLFCSRTYLIMVFERQRALPTSNAEPQTTPLARHFDL